MHILNGNKLVSKTIQHSIEKVFFIDNVIVHDNLFL